ncbi:MAG: hypothetical protein GC150_14105 [Rhizobiales bacterium]|nr:hypothetical protein [Hyphomicrobiales bacterium]
MELGALIDKLALGPVTTAVGVTLAVLVVLRILRGIFGFFVTIYLLIGVVSYLYWIHVEAGPPHGTFTPSFETGSEIAYQAVIAAVAIVGWPFWPVTRAWLLG